ncbi:MAG: hypothetical protein DRP84_06370 [Spirochaetes bacterium]|nr:MAG: hypothetical protein DRP84_06370 [Spirochaetota bacterium]
MVKKILIPLLIISLSLNAIGCSKNKITELKKEQLFKIKIGKRDEEIGTIRNKNGLFKGPGELIFRNGFFFIVDNINQKIMKITTLGDVILILKNGEQESKAKNEQILKTKVTKNYPFQKIGFITVDGENNIYVEDKFVQAPKQPNEIDILSNSNKNISSEDEKYMSYILKFDRLGNFIAKIGKNGIDTDPFYYIYRLDIDKNDNLVVITSDDNWDRWDYYKYNKDGKPIMHEVISKKDIIKIDYPKDRGFFIMDVVPEAEDAHLIYWISMFDTTYDTKGRKEEQNLWGEEIEIDKLEKKIQKEEKKRIDYKRDLIFYKLLFYNLFKRKIDKTYIWENRTGKGVETTQEFIGVDGNANGFLWKYVDNKTAIITIFKPDGTTIARRSFKFENNGIWQNIVVNRDGSMSAIKVGKNYIYFYRWRSDELINNKINNNENKKSFKEFIKEKIEAFKNANK